MIGRALEKFLTESDEYRYSLELRRSLQDVDPVEDFLFHTKVGPCTRFASAAGGHAAINPNSVPDGAGFRGADSRGRRSLRRAPMPCSRLGRSAGLPR